MIWVVIVGLVVVSLVALMFPEWVDDGLRDVRRRDRAMARLKRIHEEHVDVGD